MNLNPHDKGRPHSAPEAKPRSPIRVLEASLVDQIAAGEVVERPASVVKELLENALDAGARSLRVETEVGGTARILVVDDGNGIPRNEIPLSVVRHATSKIRTLDDLIRIASMGFRGEALPSIASVSHLTITSRTASEAEGTRIEVHGGAPPEVRPAGAPLGTSVEVRGLFYNVPARQKFLKGPATENAHISETCLRLALLDPNLRLTVVRDGRTVREYLPVNDLATRVRGALRDEPLEWIEGDRDGIRVSAVLGPPERARRGAKSLHLFVNRRALRDRALSRAVAFAYGSVLAPGHFPTGAVYVDLDPEQVDVNVHPQKTEVRFRDGRHIYDTITRILAAQLGTTAWGPRPTATTDTRTAPTLSRDASFWDERLGARPDAPTGVADAPLRAGTNSTFPTGSSSEEAALLEPRRGAFGALRVLAQVRDMILICQSDDALCLIDQHAADERVRFAKLKRAYEKRDVTMQRLLFPERVELSATETASVDKHENAIRQIGIDVTVVGPTTVAIHAVPHLLRAAKPEHLLRDLIAEITHSGDRAFGDRVDLVLATMACHSSIRGGDRLSPEEAQALLNQLDAVEDFASYCPHGRPIIMSIPFREIERKLGR